MRYEAKSITIEEARQVLHLDANKDVDDIAAILGRRGIEAEAELDAAMTPADIRQDSILASLDLISLSQAPGVFRVKGFEIDASGAVAQAYDWQRGDAMPFYWEAN